MTIISSSSVPTMSQSDFEDCYLYIIDPSVDGIITGVMGGCVSVVALSSPVHGVYQNICGQHGAGGIRAVNFPALMKAGKIEDSMRTKFIVVFADSVNTPESVLFDIENLLEDDLKFIKNSEFEFYFSSNAKVNRYGRVFDATTRVQLPRRLIFIAKFQKMLRIYRTYL